MSRVEPSRAVYVFTFARPEVTLVQCVRAEAVTLRGVARSLAAARAHARDVELEARLVARTVVTRGLLFVGFLFVRLLFVGRLWLIAVRLEDRGVVRLLRRRD